MVIVQIVVVCTYLSVVFVLQHSQIVIVVVALAIFSVVAAQHLRFQLIILTRGTPRLTLSQTASNVQNIMVLVAIMFLF
jgi:hypothetical protein